MLRGDLVRCWILEVVKDHPYCSDGPFDDPYAPTVQRNVPRVGIVVEYEKYEKIATVLLQDSGKVARVRASDIELIKRSPENKALLKALAEKKQNNS